MRLIFCALFVRLSLRGLLPTYALKFMFVLLLCEQAILCMADAWRSIFRNFADIFAHDCLKHLLNWPLSPFPTLQRDNLASSLPSQTAVYRGLVEVLIRGPNLGLPGGCCPQIKVGLSLIRTISHYDSAECRVGFI